MDRKVSALKFSLRKLLRDYTVGNKETEYMSVSIKMHSSG